MMHHTHAQLLQDLWLEPKRSPIDELIRPYTSRSKKSEGQAKETSISVITHEERVYQNELDAIRTFGYTWLKPIGVRKTLAQQEEEMREVHESYEEYEDEDNQNTHERLEPDMDGDEDDGDRDGDADLDGAIEEGASFAGSLQSSPVIPRAARAIGYNDATRTGDEELDLDAGVSEGDASIGGYSDEDDDDEDGDDEVPDQQ